MLAYTLNRNGRSWKAEIRAAISAYVPPVLGVADALIHGDSEPATFSRHERLALELDPIAILHLEMLFELEETSAEQPSDSGPGPENGS